MKKTISVLLFLLLMFCFAFSANCEQVSELNTETTQQAEIAKPAQVKGLAVKRVSANSIILRWNSQKNADGYAVYKFDGKKNKYVRIDGSFENYYTVNKLNPSTNYSFLVRAFKLNEEFEPVFGPKSESITARTAPAKVKSVFSTDITGTTITLQWSTVNGAETYQLFMFSRKTGSYERVKTISEASFTVSNLSVNTVYLFKVRACVKNGDSTVYGEFSPEIAEYTNKTGQPKTNAQVAKLYNTKINNLKLRKNVTVSYRKSVSTEPTYSSKYSLIRTMKNLLNMFEGTIKSTYVFKNGRAQGTTVNTLVQPYGKNARLRGKDIQSFSVNYGGKTNNISIKLSPDESILDVENQKTSPAPTTSRALKLVNITKKKITPVRFVSGKQIYNDVSISLKMLKDGTVSELKIKNPVKVDANCAVSTLDFAAKGYYTVTENYVFK